MLVLTGSRDASSMSYATPTTVAALRARWGDRLVSAGCREISCDDAWREDGPETLEETGADMMIALNGSGYTADIMDQRLAAMSRLLHVHGYPIIHTNPEGGQDGMVFDGGGFCINPGGDFAGCFPLAETGVFNTRWMRVEGKWRCVGFKGLLRSV